MHAPFGLTQLLRSGHIAVLTIRGVRHGPRVRETGLLHEEGGRAHVSQVQRDGFESILAQDADKAGRGRGYISLDGQQTKALVDELGQRSIPLRRTHWGMPVIEIVDIDLNELYFSPPSP